MKLKVLYIIHAFHNLAGVEEFLKALVGSLSDDYEPWILFPYKGALHLGRPPIPRDDPTTFRFPFSQLEVVVPHRDALCELTLNYAFELVKPDLIHIVHFVSYPLSLFEIVLNRHKPTVITFHDYYSIHPYYTLEYCTDPREALTPEYSLRTMRQDISGYVNRRVDFMKQVLDRIPYQIVPSPFLRRRLATIYPDRFQVIEYGIEPFAIPKRARTWQPFRFGFFGSLLPQKGWDSLIEPFRRIRSRHPGCELHFFGGVGPNEPGIFFHGVYLRPELPQLMSHVDVGLIPSRFAETYSLVLSELWRCGTPTAVAAIGAMGERVHDMVNGRTFTSDDPARIEEVLEWFLTSDAWRQWKLPNPRTGPEMALEYESLYQSALAGKSWTSDATPLELPR